MDNSPKDSLPKRVFEMVYGGRGAAPLGRGILADVAAGAERTIEEVLRDQYPAPTTCMPPAPTTSRKPPVRGFRRRATSTVRVQSPSAKRINSGEVKARP